MDNTKHELIMSEEFMLSAKFQLLYCKGGNAV